MTRHHMPHPADLDSFRAELAHPHAPHILQRVLDELAGLPSALRQNLTDELWSRISSGVDESVYQPAQLVSSPLYVQAVTSTPETISTVVASIPAGATAVVRLDSTVIPIGGGLTIIPGLNKLLGPTAERSITLTSMPTPTPTRTARRVSWTLAADPPGKLFDGGSGTLWSVNVVNRDTGTHTIQIRDSALNAGDSQPMLATYNVNSGNTGLSTSIPASGLRFANGLFVSITTPIAADGQSVFADAQYTLDPVPPPGGYSGPVGLWLTGMQAPTFGVVG